MSQFEHLSNLGLKQSLHTDSLKRLQLVNLISYIAFTIAIVMVLVNSMVNLIGTLPILLIFAVSTLIPVFLNKFEYYIASRVYFLLQAYVLIFLLSVLFPIDFGYKYYLIPGVGMPLIFFKNEIGNKKWALSFIAFPAFLLIEWVNINTPIAYDLYLSPLQLLFMQSANYLVTLFTSFVMFYLFTKQSDLQFDTIEAQNEKLSILNKDLEDFSYILTHDLKAPLINIRGVLDLIDQEYKEELNDELVHLFELLGDRAQKMDTLIQDVLSYSKLGYQKISISTINLNYLIEQCISNILVPKHFEFKISNLPSIESNATQLGQVLTNLIGNAIKYHDKEKGLIEVQFEDKDPHFYKFSIIDNGPGIAPEDHDKVFEFMGTAHKTARTDSTGIGLAIVKKLVSIHQGEIGVISELGQGANFWFTWPKTIKPKS